MRSCVLFCSFMWLKRLYRERRQTENNRFGVCSAVPVSEKTYHLERALRRKPFSTRGPRKLDLWYFSYFIRSITTEREVFCFTVSSFPGAYVYTLQRLWKEQVFLPTLEGCVLLVCVPLRRILFRVAFDRKKFFFSKQKVKLSNFLKRERKESLRSSLSKRCSLQRNHRF